MRRHHLSPVHSPKASPERTGLGAKEYGQDENDHLHACNAWSR